MEDTAVPECRVKEISFPVLAGTKNRKRREQQLKVRTKNEM